MRSMRISIATTAFWVATAYAQQSPAAQSGTPNSAPVGNPTLAIQTAVLAVASDNTISEANRDTVSKDLMDKVRRSTERRVRSPEFRISQHVDHFPPRPGPEPVLPMSSLIEWTGPGRGPEQISVVESIDDLSMSASVMERAIQVRWDGHQLAWERDGRLHPGHYLWRIAVHDGDGKVYASAEQKITVEAPRQASIEVSSLIMGKSCEEQVGSVNGLRRRTTIDRDNDVKLHSQSDPMRAADCRITPEASDRFAPSDRLHAFVRIYPTEKLEKRGPASWTAKFILWSKNNPIATEKETAFRVDSSAGYLAYVVMSLDTPGMPPGQYTLDVVMRGPGIRKELKESRSISIQAPAAAQQKNSAADLRKTD
jgi:hypothetical protein